jgi:hypothetical protein
MKELDTNSEHYLTRVVAVGQFATHLPNYTDTRCIVYITGLCYKVRLLHLVFPILFQIANQVSLCFLWLLAHK